jgi:hypothetical protein
MKNLPAWLNSQVKYVTIGYQLRIQVHPELAGGGNLQHYCEELQRRLVSAAPVVMYSRMCVPPLSVHLQKRAMNTTTARECIATTLTLSSFPELEERNRKKS